MCRMESEPEREGLTVLVLFIAALLVSGWILAGCATSQLADDATALEKKAAMCADAKAGIAMADAALADPKLIGNEDATRYWMAFRAGAVVAISIYCGPSAVPGPQTRVRPFEWRLRRCPA